MEWFRNRLEARVVIEDWRPHYNAVRSHSSFNYLIPNEFVEGLQNDLSTETRKLSAQWWKISGRSEHGPWGIASKIKVDHAVQFSKFEFN